jgi:hypothetical protein
MQAVRDAPADSPSKSILEGRLELKNLDIKIKTLGQNRNLACQKWVGHSFLPLWLSLARENAPPLGAPLREITTARHTGSTACGYGVMANGGPSKAKPNVCVKLQAQRRLYELRGPSLKIAHLKKTCERRAHSHFFSAFDWPEYSLLVGSGKVIFKGKSLPAM